MLSDKFTEEQLKIRIHHIGGIGGYGPSEVLDKLEHVEWIIYDADADSLSLSSSSESVEYKFVNRCVGGNNSQAQFHILSSPTASSMLKPAKGARLYTLMLGNGTARVWGEHTKLVKSVDMNIDTLDSLVESSEVPPVDYLSVDAQGAELQILEGASKVLATRTLGVLCEVEFAELYENQPLFCDTQKRLLKDRFRLCEIYSHQYLTTNLLCPELQGKGFLTVGEALFLKNIDVWNDTEDDPLFSSDNDIVQGLKLAAIAVAFDQLDYALGICRYLEKKNLVSLDNLAEKTNIKYINLLRDLYCAADSIQKTVPVPHLEPIKTSLIKDVENPTKESLKDSDSLITKFKKFLMPFVPQLIHQIIFNLRLKNMPGERLLISRILSKYGFDELSDRAAKRARDSWLRSLRL
jgi:FkbM family methyltransferase